MSNEKTHRGEIKVELTKVTDAPFWSVKLNKLFANKGLARAAEKRQAEKEDAKKFERKLDDLKRFGIGGAKEKYRKKRRR